MQSIYLTDKSNDAHGADTLLSSLVPGLNSDRLPLENVIHMITSVLVCLFVFSV